jgi:hypothetical protein
MKKFALVAVVVLLGGVAAARAEDGFTGTWDTTFGPLTMIQKGKKVTGTYYDGKAKLEGTVEGNKLKFDYQEKAQGGQGEFDLSADGKSFTGKWRVVGEKKWQEWNGARK